MIYRTANGKAELLALVTNLINANAANISIARNFEPSDTFTVSSDIAGLRPATDAEAVTAVQRYGDEGIEVDGDALAADAEDGAVWVQAWLRIEKDDQ